MRLRDIVLAVFAALIALAFEYYARADEPTLIGGRIVENGEYDEVIKTRYGMSSCTAAIIGPFAVMTAGHCVSEGGQIDYQIGQTLYKALCNRTPKYNQTKREHDLAICKSDKEMKVKFAHLSDYEPKMSEKVTLIGYGCKDIGGTDNSYGVLRTGESTVSKQASANYMWFEVRKDAVLCYGDSGGPAFKKIGNSYAETHFLIGVNSRGDIQEASHLTAVYRPESRSFLSQWATKNQVKICGLNDSCGMVLPPNPPIPQPEPSIPKVCKRKQQKAQRAYEKYQVLKAELDACAKSPTSFIE